MQNSSGFGQPRFAAQKRHPCCDSKGGKLCEYHWDFNTCLCVSVLQFHGLILLKSPLYTSLTEPFCCRNNGGQKGDGRADDQGEG